MLVSVQFGKSEWALPLVTTETLFTIEQHTEPSLPVSFLYIPVLNRTKEKLFLLKLNFEIIT